MAITPNDLQAKSAGGFGTVAHGIITLLRQWYSSGITILAGFTGTTLTLSGAAPATPVANRAYLNSLCKAWVNFNGTGTPAIRSSFNASSITDIGVGQYEINLALAMSNTGYAAPVTASNGGGASGSASVVYSTTKVKVTTYSIPGLAFLDCDWISLTIHGD